MEIPEFGKDQTTLWLDDRRRSWRWDAAERLWQDVRYGFRALAKNPGFTAAAVLALGLGIGANLAIFTFMDRLLLRPLPFPAADRLVSIYHRTSGDAYLHASLPYPDYLYYRDHNAVFSGLAAYTEAAAELRMGARAETVSGEVVSANYFPVLGAQLQAGRNFLPEEDAVPGRDPVVIIGSDLWQQRLGGDAAVVGRQIILNHTSFTIIGVAPRGFAGLRLDRAAKPKFWVPTMMYPAVFGTEQDRRYLRDNEWLQTIGRLRDPLPTGAAEANLSDLTARLLQGAGGYETGRSCLLIAANAVQIAPERRNEAARLIGMLMAVTGLVLLIACANVAGLLTGRALKRRREMGVRLALGAGRGRLFQQLFTESLLLSLLGAAAGLAVSWMTTRLLAGLDRPFRAELLLDTGLDGRVLAYVLTISILSALVFGIIPLRHAFRIQVVDALRSDVAPTGLRRFGLRNVLVVVQVALTFVLLVGSGLFLRTLRNAQATDVTRGPEHVLLLHLAPGKRKYDDDRGKRFYASLLDRLRTVPGVEGVALVNQVPMGGRRNARTVVPRLGGPEAGADFNIVSDDYFRMVGLPIERGRGFNAQDREGAPGVAVVNELMAQRFWPGEDPIGKRFGILKPNGVVEVIGVVRDGRFRNYRDAPRPCFYLPLAQNYAPRMSLEIRTPRGPERVVTDVRREIADLDKEMPIGEVQTLRAYRDGGLGQERLSAAMLTGLGLLAMILAAIGICGVLAFSVAQRTREIGLRVALGATNGNVVKLVLSGAFTLAIVGAGLGLVAAWLLSRLVSGMLYGITATDPLTYAGAICLLFAVGLVAAYIPARRAIRIDPIEALRHE